MADIGQLIAGRLQEHGRAHYRFRGAGDLSYFVKVLTSSGERVVWGKDLDRAVHAGRTRPQIGDLIGVRIAAREKVNWTERLHSRHGQVLDERRHSAYRNRWEVEKITYFSERARLAREVRERHMDTREMMRAHPELKSSFVTARAAQEFADERIADPKERVRFLELVQGAIAGSIRKGQPVPEVRIKDAVHTAAQRILSLRTSARDHEPVR